MSEEAKPKVMIKSEGGFVMTKREMKTVNGETWWQYDQAASDGSAVFKTGKDPAQVPGKRPPKRLEPLP